jgi:4-amino-4-deoxy-L-arabinose transferase-like glycosyltransferase
MPAAPRSRRALLAVLALAAAVRLSVPMALAWRGDASFSHSIDTPGYLQPAMSAAAGRGFSWYGQPEVIYPPGYAVFLLPGVMLGHVEAVTIALQVLTSCLTVWLVYRIGLLLLSPGAAMLAALLYALEPLSVLYTSVLMSETPFTALLVASVYFALRFLGGRQARHAALAGLFIAAATYVRPVGYVMAVALVGGLALWAAVRLRERWRILPELAVFLACAILPTVPWTIRNKAVANYGGFASNMELVVYCAHGGSVLAVHEGLTFPQLTERLGCSGRAEFDRLHPELRDWREKARFMRREGWRMVASDPLTYAKEYLKALAARTFGPAAGGFIVAFHGYRDDQLPRNQAESGSAGGLVRHLLAHPEMLVWTALLTAYLLACFALAVPGLLADRFALTVNGWALMVVMLYLLLAAPVGTPRYRHPVMPLLCLVAARGAAELLEARRRRSFAVTAEGADSDGHPA